MLSLLFLLRWQYSTHTHTHVHIRTLTEIQLFANGNAWKIIHETKTKKNDDVCIYYVWIAQFMNATGLNTLARSVLHTHTHKQSESRGQKETHSSFFWFLLRLLPYFVFGHAANECCALAACSFLLWRCQFCRLENFVVFALSVHAWPAHCFWRCLDVVVVMYVA